MKLEMAVAGRGWVGACWYRFGVERSLEGAQEADGASIGMGRMEG